MEHRKDPLREINSWLGWGDPDAGLWFVGIEEGAKFSPLKIAAMRGRRYSPVLEVRERRSPIALRTARIVCLLAGTEDAREYARARMGWPGSKVFNANLFPIGKPSLSAWPSNYKRLLGVTRAEYLARRDTLSAERAAFFRQLRADRQPQAVICFGKSCWTRFEEVFVRASARPRRPDRTLDILAYESDRVILTPHFSRGSLMRNAD